MGGAVAELVFLWRRKEATEMSVQGMDRLRPDQPKFAIVTGRGYANIGGGQYVFRWPDDRPALIEDWSIDGSSGELVVKHIGTVTYRDADGTRRPAERVN